MDKNKIPTKLREEDGRFARKVNCNKEKERRIGNNCTVVGSFSMYDREGTWEETRCCCTKDCTSNRIRSFKKKISGDNEDGYSLKRKWNKRCGTEFEAAEIELHVKTKYKKFKHPLMHHYVFSISLCTYTLHIRSCYAHLECWFIYLHK